VTSTRARRLSFTGPCGAAASGDLPAAPSGADASGPPAAKASSSSASSEQGSGAGNQAPPTPGEQAGGPEAHPLPQRRVRFEDSPVKTHGRREEEDAPLPPALAAAPPLAQPLSPAQAAAAAFAAAEARLRRSLGSATSPGRPGSPSRAAAAVTVPMKDVIQSVASLSRAGKEPTFRKTNQVGDGAAAALVLSWPLSVSDSISAAGGHDVERRGAPSSLPVVWHPPCIAAGQLLLLLPVLPPKPGAHGGTGRARPERTPGGAAGCWAGREGGRVCVW
jgi:hypothetical protein